MKLYILHYNYIFKVKITFISNIYNIKKNYNGIDKFFWIEFGIINLNEINDKIQLKITVLVYMSN